MKLEKDTKKEDSQKGTRWQPIAALQQKIEELKEEIRDLSIDEQPAQPEQQVQGSDVAEPLKKGGGLSLEGLSLEQCKQAYPHEAETEFNVRFDATFRNFAFLCACYFLVFFLAHLRRV